MDNRQISRQSLLNQLETFTIGPPAARLTFERRLARENGWSVDFATRVSAEYRRFIFLMVEAGHPITPSEQVDQAWHLHMVYTRSYWTDLCANIVGKPLHHTPTEGGGDEDRKFENWYARTLESYERLFGHHPPEDIWPPVEVRFATRPARWVTPSDHWIIPKPTIKRWPLAAASVACAATLGGCSLLLNQSNSDVVIPLLILAGFLILVVGLLSLVKRGQSNRSNSNGCTAGGCGGFSGCSSKEGSDSGCSGGDSGCGGGGCGGGGD
jgi:hypothetical protein